MIVRLDTHRLQTLDQVREFLAGSEQVDLQPQTRADSYALVAKTVRRFDYALRGKADKGLLRRFLAKVAGLSRAQITRLLQQHRTTGEIADRRDTPRRPFPRRYSNADIGLLAELDVLHGTLSGPATRKLCARAFHLFGDRRFERLAGISNGHLYNLRHTTSYQRRRGTTPLPTRPVQVVIGDRRRPQPFGQPGWVRVDTVHQGDLDGIKGLYHVNLADEVTQFQCIGSVEHIHAACLAPVLDALLRAFPFTLHGFHADNGSEFINREVAALLQGLHIDAFTKSRARRSTDNALVESKNGSVIRKQLGHGHIPSRCAAQVNAFTQQVLSPYLNFHRPCFFPTEEVDRKGRRAQALPRRRHHDPLREAQVVARRRRLPEARNHLRKARRGRVRDERQRSRAGARRGPHALVPVHPPSGLKVCSGPLPPPVGRRRVVDEQARGSSNTGRANSRGRCRARIAGADSRRHRLRSNTDGQRCRRARIAGADLRRHRLQHHRKAEARRHQARAPTTIHPAVAGRFTAPRVVTSSPSAAGSALGYRTPQTSTDGRSLRLVSCCSEPGKPDPHRSVATAAATAPSP